MHESSRRRQRPLWYEEWFPQQTTTYHLDVWAIVDPFSIAVVVHFEGRIPIQLGTLTALCNFVMQENDLSGAFDSSCWIAPLMTPY